MSKINLVKIGPKYWAFCMQTYVMFIVTGDSKNNYPRKPSLQRLRWCGGSVLASDTQVRGFKPGQSRRIFKGR
jgi:hypothetical protein